MDSPLDKVRWGNSHADKGMIYYHTAVQTPGEEYTDIWATSLSDKGFPSSRVRP